MKKYKYRTVSAIGHRRTPKFFSINVGTSPGSRDGHRGRQWDSRSAGLCLWLKKFGCDRVGFAWGRQWLTLCSICFFRRNGMIIRMVTEKKAVEKHYKAV